MKLHIHHRTCYRYATRVSFGPHRLLLRPRESHSIKLEKFSLKIEPAHRLRWTRDLHENNMGLLELTESATELLVELECEVDMREVNPFEFVIDREAADYPFIYSHESLRELRVLAEPLYPRDLERIGAWLHPLWHPGRRIGTLALLQNINNIIYSRIKYQRRDRRGVQSPAETLELGSGSCRDFAALFMETCRYLGLAARFVSGYMYHSTIKGRMSMHGWAEVYLPGAGWIGFDPSWGILADSQYVPVAVTRHPEHAPPISGSFFGYPRDFIHTDIELYVKKVGEGLQSQAQGSSGDGLGQSQSQSSYRSSTVQTKP